MMAAKKKKPPTDNRPLFIRLTVAEYDELEAAAQAARDEIGRPMKTSTWARSVLLRNARWVRP